MEINTFEDAVYNSKTVVHVLEQYVDFLAKQEDPYGQVKTHINALNNFKRYLVRKDLYEEQRELLNLVFDDLKEKNLFFEISGRRKSLVSFEQKLRTSLAAKKGVNVRDIMAYRIILNSSDTANCYTAADIIADVFQKQAFILTDVDKSLQFDDSPCQSIKYGVKDYIANPKENGYRSLHLVFMNSVTNEFMEVQIRTLEMEADAVSGEASHNKYKENNYAQIQLQHDKITMQGFMFKNGITLDQIGLISARKILMRSRSS